MKATKRLTMCALLVATVISLTLLYTGCATGRAQVSVPALDFPLFPAPPDGDVIFDEDSGRVNMSLDYFERIYEYKVQVDETQRVYEGLRELLESNKVGHQVRDKTSGGRD